MSHSDLNRTDEQFLVSIRGVKIRMCGRAPLILALGLAAAMGAVVVVKVTFPEESAGHLHGGPGNEWPSVTSADMTHLPEHDCARR